MQATALFTTMHGMLAAACLAFLVISSDAIGQEDAVRRASQLMVEGQTAEAEALLRSSMAGGNPQAATFLGTWLFRTQRYEEAIQVLEPLATQGDAEAQYQLSQVYGLKSPPDFERSSSWIHRAATAGHSRARIVLQEQAELKADKEGKVSTLYLVEMTRTLMAKKIEGFNERVLGCYGATRPQLLAAFNTSLGKCFESLPADQRDRVLPTHTFLQSLAACTNSELFASVGKTPAQLVACLP